MKSPFSTRRANVAAGVLAAVMAISVLGGAIAEEKTAPRSQQAPKTMPHSPQAPMQGMGPMQQQMMHGMMQQMQTCMEQMGAMDEAAREQMRSQMMGRMQSCMGQMQSGEAKKNSKD